MTTLEILKAARALIDREEKWTRGAVARTAHGYQVQSIDDSAVQFCILGALAKASNNWKLCLMAGDSLRGLLKTAIQEFNDAPTTTHADVLALFDRAIAAEECAK